MFKKSGKTKKTKNRKISKMNELLSAAILLILISVVVRAFLVLPYKLPDESMKGGLYSGDFLLSSKISYKFGRPAVGDVVVFNHPFRPGDRLARRIVATEGQTVEIVGKMVYVNDEPFAECPSVTHSDYRILPSDFSNRDYAAPQKVPSGQIYVMADNRDQAEDSRDFGFINVSQIEGKGMFVYFSWAPDPNAPRWESPYITPAIQIFFYNLFHFPTRIRWDRLFASS